MNDKTLVERLRVWRKSEFGQSPAGYMFEEAATRIEALEAALPPVGANGLYVCDGLGLSCTVIGHVEGWLEVKFHGDQSTCIVRPSRFNPQGGPQ